METRVGSILAVTFETKSGVVTFRRGRRVRLNAIPHPDYKKDWPNLRVGDVGTVVEIGDEDGNIDVLAIDWGKDASGEGDTRTYEGVEDVALLNDRRGSVVSLRP